MTSTTNTRRDLREEAAFLPESLPELMELRERLMATGGRARIVARAAEPAGRLPGAAGDELVPDRGGGVPATVSEAEFRARFEARLREVAARDAPRVVLEAIRWVRGELERERRA
jgi:hypothetical protein